MEIEGVDRGRGRGGTDLIALDAEFGTLLGVARPELFLYHSTPGLRGIKKKNKKQYMCAYREGEV